jgi:hypothetical protein
MKWIREHLVPEACEWWKLWSLRLNAIGLAIIAWVQFDPVSVLSVWNMMPANVRHVLPVEIVTAIGLALFVLSMIARLVKQPKLEKNNAE